MTKKVIAPALAVALALVTAPAAFASQCPARHSEVQAELARSGKPDDAKAKARALADEGMQAHNAGNHDEAMRKLNEALDMLK